MITRLAAVNPARTRPRFTRRRVPQRGSMARPARSFSIVNFHGFAIGDTS